MTPPNHETLLRISRTLWKMLLPACDVAEGNAIGCTFVAAPAPCHARQHTLLLTDGVLEPQPNQLQSGYPDRGDGAAAARQAALAEKGLLPLGQEHNFPVPLHIPRSRSHPSNTQGGTQLTSLGRVCLPKPTQCWVEGPSECHSAATPSPQPGKEQCGGVSALAAVQGHCPEQKTPHSHLPRHDTQGNPGSFARQVHCSHQHKSHQQPWASDSCGCSLLRLQKH